MTIQRKERTRRDCPLRRLPNPIRCPGRGALLLPGVWISEHGALGPGRARACRIECPECGFSFIVGDIAVATCPNCATEVRTGKAGLDEEE